ncbi:MULTISPECIES: hypothetical protein [Anaerotruncus]|jgi:hypothetical protein|uniref:hypothetical protein n=1 Tax=Anaerotruncus TaxID=244127 RepID=UPI000E54DFCD|nr:MULTISPECIES: hypothetical protein [Anaerotruncus]RGX53031.1 hypothetical protein DWV16_17420 [Anaerotruncus sp. AF02-27]
MMETILEKTGSDEQTVQPGQDAFIPLLRQMQEESARQTACLKKQLFMARLCAVFTGAALLVVIVLFSLLVPRLTGLVGAANDVVGQAGVVLADLQNVSAELSEADIGGVLKNVDGLVLQSRDGIVKALDDVEKALSVIEGVDIATLNKAIKDLHDVVSPLSRMFGGGQ